MATPSLKFGTDGWRAVIADQYTFDNLERVARATAQWLRKRAGDAPTVVVGHDTRFLGRRFAEHAARVFGSYGIRVTMASTFAPTPAVSWASKAYGCDAGIVITASHNPPEYNGFKIKSSLGGPATPEMIAEVEAELAALEEGPELATWAALTDAGTVVERDVASEYLDMLREKIDVEAIRASGLRIAHDAMYGAGQTMLTRLLGDEHVVPLHGVQNPGFDGQAPEPIERNLQELSDAVVREGCDAGIANDGDADRVGMVDEQGRFVDSHRILALLARYLYEERGERGDIVKTFSTTHMLDKMGERYGLTVQTLPIGFKYIAPKIIEGDVLVGGEESGGIAVKGHLPERDGLYIGLLVLEMMVRQGASLSTLVQQLFDAYGPHAYYRVDVHTSEEKKQRVLARLAGGGLAQLAGEAVLRVDDLDGYKHVLGSGWLLVRPSGTEPVLRVYAEAPTPEAAQALVDDAVQQLGV